jgi:hypothetical protein
MTNVIHVNFSQKRITENHPDTAVISGVTQNRVERPSDSAISNLILNLEDNNYFLINNIGPKITECQFSNLWVAKVALERRNRSRKTTMFFWYDGDLITHTASCPYGGDVPFAQSDRVDDL